MKKKIFIPLGIAIGILSLLFAYFFLGSAPAANPEWGVNFSQKHAQALGLDWKDAYIKILDDLGTKNIRLVAYWDEIEANPDQFDFSNIIIIFFTFFHY